MLLIGVWSLSANPTVKINGVAVTIPVGQTTASGTSRLLVAEFTNVGPNPFDGHAVGRCDSTFCPTTINTASFSVSGNDVVWAWCGADFGGAGSGVGCRRLYLHPHAKHRHRLHPKISGTNGGGQHLCPMRCFHRVAAIAIRGK